MTSHKEKHKTQKIHKQLFVVPQAVVHLFLIVKIGCYGNRCQICNFVGWFFNHTVFDGMIYDFHMYM